MECIYCKSDTEIYNSRSSKKNSSVWRRRRCKTCVAQFTTYELPDYASALSIKGQNGKLYPFSRDRLFLSVYRALGHRKDALNSATELATTIIGKLLQDYEEAAKIPVKNLTLVTYKTLNYYDKYAGDSYKAYHQSLLS